MITVYPLGTTIYDPERCQNGYTIFGFPYEPVTLLVDMNGNITNKWDVRAIRARLLENGNLLAVERKGGEKNTVKELDWEGRLVWEYGPSTGAAHHDVVRLGNGNTLVLCKEPVPEEYRKRVKDPVRRSVPRILGDLILEVTPDKETVWEWHSYEHIDINRCCKVCNPGDWTHTNTVQALPENRHYDAGDVRFRPGNMLLSPRNLSFIFIVDRETKEIVWEYVGKYAGGLAGQHEPHMIEKGLPGEGNIIIFDNGAPPMRAIAHTGKSYILEIDPVTQGLVWKYENGEKFYSAFRSNVQRLPNGNTLICESEGPRVFEVTHEGEIVWEYAIEWQRIVGRSYRYPYDYCPQLAALGKPEEKSIRPPAHARVFAQDQQAYLALRAYQQSGGRSK